MKITTERVLAASVVAAFYPLYAAAFAPLRTRAAARHVLTADEFAAEMADERIDKYVVWDDSGAPVAMTTLATDLAAVGWISPEYFAARHPDEFARGAVFYLGYTLVHPEHANQGVFQLMTDTIERRCAEVRAVCAFDVCAYNDAGRVGRRIALLASGNWNVDAVDVQTYYAASWAGKA
jgi:GNAT superfamily N-acetyltransferase